MDAALEKLKYEYRRCKVVYAAESLRSKDRGYILQMMHVLFAMISFSEPLISTVPFFIYQK